MVLSRVLLERRQVLGGEGRLQKILVSCTISPCCCDDSCRHSVAPHFLVVMMMVKMYGFRRTIGCNGTDFSSQDA